MLAGFVLSFLAKTFLCKEVYHAVVQFMVKAASKRELLQFHITEQRCREIWQHGCLSVVVCHKDSFLFGEKGDRQMTVARRVIKSSSCLLGFFGLGRFRRMAMSNAMPCGSQLFSFSICSGVRLLFRMGESPVELIDQQRLLVVARGIVPSAPQGLRGRSPATGRG